MNPMNAERFFDLAMKVIGGQAVDAERAELDALLKDDSALRIEFSRLQTDAHMAKDVLPLVTACNASTGEFPAYAREQLQTTVRQTLGRPESPPKQQARGFALEPSVSFMPAYKRQEAAPLRPSIPNPSPAWDWRWVLGLAAVTAVVVLVALPTFRTSNAPMIQLAMLDTVGGTRGADTDEVATLQKTWKGSSVQHFSNTTQLESWEKQWPNGGGRPAAKIVYDPAAGEVRVTVLSKGRAFQHTFPLDRDLPTTLQAVNAFVRARTQP